MVRTKEEIERLARCINYSAEKADRERPRRMVSEADSMRSTAGFLAWAAGCRILDQQLEDLMRKTEAEVARGN